MGRNWEPDFPLDTELAHRIVSAQFPEYADRMPSHLGAGWDNFCIVYSDQTVFRLPTRKMGGELITGEIHALPLLAGQLELPIPNLTHVGEPSEIYPYAFMGYPFLPGETADRLTWTHNERMKVIPQLARFLGALHSMPIEGPLAELVEDNYFRKDPASLVEKIENRIRELDEYENAMPIDKLWLLNWAREIASHAVPTNKVAVLHGDLYPRHILANDQREITGIIDWGDIHRGHPAVDLSIAYSFAQGTDERMLFFDHYGIPVAENDKRLAMLRAAMYGVSLTHYGIDNKDGAILSLGHAILLQTAKEGQ